MACACPCFGDEADAEEKPNQMIQLDGLGMLRLDTQHVGQGSQGARSAKWFYFGETDNRLAVVNMLLCITCFLMWILFISAASPYIWGANPSGESNNGAGKQNFNGVEEDATNNAIGSTHIDQKATEQTMDVDNLITTLYPVVKKYENAQAAFDRLKILEASKENWEKNKTKITNMKAEKSALHAKKVQLEQKIEKHKDAKKLLGNKVGELKDDITKLNTDLSSKDDDITKLNKDLSSKEGLLNLYRKGKIVTFMNYFASHDPERVQDEEWKKKTERERFNHPDDPVAYEKWLRDVHAEEYKDYQATIISQPKDGDDPKRNNEFAVNNTNDVGNQKGYKEPETNDDNQ
eukprot:175849_1